MRCPPRITQQVPKRSSKGFVVSSPSTESVTPTARIKVLKDSFQTKKSNKIFYYDKKAGKYYDPDSDIYLDVSDIMEETEQVEEKFEFQCRQRNCTEVHERGHRRGQEGLDGQVTTMTNLIQNQRAKGKIMVNLIMKKHGGKLTRTDEIRH